MASELCPLCAQSFEANPGETVCPECASMDQGEAVSPPISPPPVIEPPAEASPSEEAAPPAHQPPFPKPEPIVHGNWGKSSKGISSMAVFIVFLLGVVVVGGIIFSAIEDRVSRQEFEEYRLRNKNKKPEAIKTSACSLCNGKKTYRCYVCREGRQYCDPCGRDGVLPSGKRCNKCLGKGVLPRKCGKCRGTSRVPCVLCAK